MTLTPCLCHLAADVEPPEPQLTPCEYFGWNLEEPAQRNSSSSPTSALPRFAHSVSPQKQPINCSAESHVPRPVCFWVRCNFLCSVLHSLQLHGGRRMRIRNLQRLPEIPLREEAGEEVVGGAVDTLHLRVYVLVKKSTCGCVCVYAYGYVCLCARPRVHGISDAGVLRALADVFAFIPAVQLLGSACAMGGSRRRRASFASRTRRWRPPCETPFVLGPVVWKLRHMECSHGSQLRCYSDAHPHSLTSRGCGGGVPPQCKY
jgi:hypothetical protein